MKSRKWLCIALLMILCGTCLAGFFQTSFNSVKIVDITLQTDAGELNGYLLVPKTATAEHPAPAIVTSHGYLNNREMQDLNYVELSRRGYVVFAMNAYAHGNSSVVREDAPSISVNTGGMVDAVEYLSSLSFVDPSRIGVTGHSMGAGFADMTACYYSGLEQAALASGASKEEAAALNKVSSALLVGNVPLNLASVAPYNCEVGIILARYDEFFITYAENIYENKSLHALISLQAEVPEVLSEAVRYENSATGKGIVVYSPKQTHPWNHFSKICCAHAIEFFEATLGAPNPIASENQIWQFKELFNCVALAGFFLLMVPLMDILLNWSFFNELRLSEPAPVPFISRSRFITSNLINALASFILIIPMFTLGFSLIQNRIWPQDTTGCLALWTLSCGLFTLLIQLKNGFKLTDVRMDKRKIGKSFLLALAVTAIAYSTVFITFWLFKSDFRIWTFAVTPFSAKKVWVAVRYLPFYLVFYVVNSIALSRNNYKGWSETKQICVSSFWNVLGILIFEALNFIPILFMKKTLLNALFTDGIAAAAGALFPLLLYPVVAILCIAAAIEIKMYHKTGNIWLAGFLNAMVITMLTVANTCFSFPY